MKSLSQDSGSSSDSEVRFLMPSFMWSESEKKESVTESMLKRQSRVTK